MVMARINKADRVDLLAQLPLFEHCTKRQLGHLASALVQADKPAGSILTREGQAGGIAYIIVSGKAEVRKGKKVVGEAGKGEMVGELALIDGRPRSASVVAVTNLDVLELSATELDRLLDTVPNFGRNLLRAMSARIRTMDARWTSDL